jgi:Tfp pilus assembly protein PilF
MEAEALNETGTLHRVNGDLAQAQGFHRQALELARATVSSWTEADALAGLGRCAVAAGQAGPAQAFLQQALEIFQQLGAAEAQDLLAEVNALTGARPAG